jgi:type I restriction enzyme S subunit
MSADWPEFQLGDRCLVRSSKRIFANEYVEFGVPFFRSKDVIDKSLGTFSGYELFISRERFEEIKLTHGIPQKGDILISSVGNRSGQPYVVQNEGDFYFKDGNILWLSNFDEINPHFLAYWLKSDAGQETLSSIMIGSAQKALTIDAIKKLWLSFPPKPDQDAAALILLSLDNKISLNTQTNQTLESIAQTIFKSWFVDFEPVKTKMAVLESLTPTLSQREREQKVLLAAMGAISGKNEIEIAQMQKENFENYSQLAETAALFPSAMVESELGETNSSGTNLHSQSEPEGGGSRMSRMIPEGWEVSSVEQQYKVEMGQSPKGESYNENGDGTLFYQGRAEFGTRFPTPRLFTTEPKKFASRGDILMSVRAPVGDLNIADNPCCIGRGLAALNHKLGGTSFAYYELKSLHPIFDRFNGEGTVFGSINQKDLKSISVISPSIEIVHQFRKAVENIDEKIYVNTSENISLANLRDSLLPKLLSGEIDLSEIQSEEA